MAIRKRRGAARTASKARRRRPKKIARRANVTVSRKVRQQPETLRLRSLEPSFTVNDLARSVRFYTDVLGFIVAERWNDDGGVLRGVRLRAGVCDLSLSQDDWAKGRDRKKGDGVRIWCKTAQDIDALAARIRTAGGRVTEEPKDQPWGARSFSADDPDGFHLTIYQER